MKNLFYIALVALAFIACDNTPTARERMELQGKVKRLIAYQCTATEKFGEIIPEDTTGISILHFDKKGNIVERDDIDQNGDTAKYFIEMCDDVSYITHNGKIVSISQWNDTVRKNTDGDGVYFTYERRMDENTWYGLAGECANAIFKTDGENEVITFYDNDGSERNAQEFYKNGKLVGGYYSRLFLFGKGTFDPEYIYAFRAEYNEQGLPAMMIDTDISDVDNTVLPMRHGMGIPGDSTVFSYTFDKQGNWTKRAAKRYYSRRYNWYYTKVTLRDIIYY